MGDQGQGAEAVRAARAVLEAVLGQRELDARWRQWLGSLQDPAGVFVTLRSSPAEELRGCVGYAEPVLPLGRALVEAAIGAACRDSRFPPLRPDELPSTVIEVTLLQRPELLVGAVDHGTDAGLGLLSDRAMLPQVVRLGTDGLIVHAGAAKGVLLPQVPLEQQWDALTYLGAVCRKAGLPPQAWQLDTTTVWRFSGQLYRERTPGGEVCAVVPVLPPALESQGLQHHGMAAAPAAPNALRAAPASPPQQGPQP